ncbi:serine hydrolase [Nakamurella endophytica]|uniref:serine hydrolase n=1 Tax=Nakamurella endophytica TaxID=1748367 RepID=UPI0035714DE6
MTAQTRFEIGSLTRTLTADLLASLVALGTVALSDPVQKFAPPSRYRLAVLRFRRPGHGAGRPGRPGHGGSALQGGAAVACCPACRCRRPRWRCRDRRWPPATWSTADRHGPRRSGRRPTPWRPPAAWSPMRPTWPSWPSGRPHISALRWPRTALSTLHWSAPSSCGHRPGAVPADGSEGLLEHAADSGPGLSVGPGGGLGPAAVRDRERCHRRLPVTGVPGPICHGGRRRAREHRHADRPRPADHPAGGAGVEPRAAGPGVSPWTARRCTR